EEQTPETLPEPEEEQTPETLPEPEEEQTPETLPEPEEEQTPETLPEPEEEQAQETLPEPEEEQAQAQPDAEIQTSPELESWSSVVTATQEVESVQAELENELNSPTPSSNPPHHDAEQVTLDPETPSPTGSFVIESSQEHPPTGWENEESTSESSTIQEPTLVMAPPIVEELLQQSVEDMEPSTPAPEVDPDAEQAKREALVTMLESEELDERDAAMAALLELGDQADIIIRNRFPGPIGFDPFTAGFAAPPLKDCNGLLAYLDKRGLDGIDVVISHLQSSNPRARFFALYLMHHHASAGHLDVIARRLYDTQPAIRIMAAETMRRHKASAQYTQVLQGLMRQLKVPVLETRVSVVQIFGQLRERRAVPVLISFLNSGMGRELVSTAVSALAVICGQEFGIDTEAWQSWWADNQQGDRGQWLCQGLLHKNPAIQNVCNTELELSSGLSMGYQPQMGTGDKKKVAARWSSWLQEQQEVDFSI
ncbi:MAG: hypothetical protein HOK28_00275, partial [Deltaproteobacteria bacterium]|nr:hypothetical protein [Deltaproteobacteria bacterium]